MKINKSDNRSEPRLSPPSDGDVLSNLAALAEEERAFATRKTAVRAAAYDDLIADLKARVLKMTEAGFNFASIGKSMGFSAAKGGTTTTPPNKPSGPTTHTGWFNLFRSRSIQAYLRTHPELAARFKADSIKSSDYPTHIPSADLDSIDAEARVSAEQRCPSAPALA